MAEKQKNMKTILVALLTLSVAVTGAFIGTLAKYVTAGTVSDEAVVAKFELEIPNTIDLFSDSYTNVEADADGKKIIAPGTTGQYAFEVTGTSEVAYKVSAGVTVSYSEEWNDYEPLEFSINGTDWTNLTDFKANLSDALAAETMAPGEEYAKTQTIYWKWPFYVSDENDIKDTQMGMAAATETAPKVTMSIEVTAAQID